MNDSELPEAYRIGWVPFIHTKIWLDSRPFIPRTETEYWVNEAIQEIKKSGLTSPRILDLCAGSGCIGVAVLKEIPKALVDFVELDEKHHPTIQKNIRENGLDETQTRIFGGDLFENIPDTYDFILSNPPYIDKSLNRVEASVIEHEPALALYGGQDGIEIIGKIIEDFEKHVTRGGILYLEHEPEHVSHLTKHFSYQDSYRDQYGKPRFSKFKAQN